MKRKIHGLFGLKHNPFLPDVPTEALYPSPRLRSFCDRVEGMAARGGYALVTGEPGSGKSAALRVVSETLAAIPDVMVGLLSRPQSSVYDFYRELGELFGVQITPTNRFGGSKSLRNRWLDHVERTGIRAVLVVDEAQEMRTEVLSEIRLLSSYLLDSQQLLLVILAGDARLLERFRTTALLPLGSRIRVQLSLDAMEPEELRPLLEHLMRQAGNPNLMTSKLVDALCEHARGNLRALMHMGAELLEAGVRQEAEQLDEKLFFEVYGDLENARPKGQRARRRSG